MTRPARRPALSFALFLAACDLGGSQPPQVAAEPEMLAPLSVGREIRLASPGDLARFGFRADGTAFAAGAATHEVEVAAGVLRVTPRHLGRPGTAIHLETTRVARGGETIDLALAGSAIDGETGGLEIARAGLTETFETFEGGVEQSWRFASPPAGNGDLVVEVAARGHEYVATTERGLHFAAAGGLGFRYSHATWISADGHEVAVPAEFAGGAIRLAVPAEVVAATRFPAVLDPVVEPEVQVDRPVLGGTGNDSDSIEVAWSGTQYLAVWRQGIQEEQVWDNVRAARIAPDGTLLDPRGFHIAGQGVDTPAVAPFGDDFLVVYDIIVSIYLARVAADGSVQQIGQVSQLNTFNDNPDIAVGDGEAMIVWHQSGTIQLARYDGATLGAPIEIAESEFYSRPRVANLPGGDYLVVWATELGNIRGRFISPGGVPGAEVAISAATVEEANAAVASTGSGFVVVWQQASGIARVRARTVSPTGAVGPALDVSSGSLIASNPSVSCQATCQIVWTGGPPDDPTLDLRSRRLDPATGTFGSETVLLGGFGTQGPGEMAGVGGQHYLVWTDSQSGIPEVYGAPAADDGTSLTVGDPTLLANNGRNIEEGAAVTASNNSWLVAWQDSRNGGSDVFGKRFGFDGVEKTPAAKPIHEGPNLQGQIALAWNGLRYLAVWSSSEPPGSAAATRLEPNLTLLDPAGIALGSGNAVGNTAVAGGDGNWLTAWGRSGLNGRRFMTAVVSADGTRSTAATLTTANGQDLAVVRDPASGVWIAAWLDFVTDQLLARRVAPDGNYLDAAPVVVASGVSGHYLEMAGGAGILMAAWIDSSTGIHGARFRIGPNGIEPLDPAGIPLVIGPETRQSLTMTFVAKSFVVAYTERAGFGYDVWGAQIAPSGALQGSPFVISDSVDQDLRPALAGASQGRALVAYTRDPDDGLARVYVRRLLVAYPDGATCTAGSQCESGFCADGRCCDSECGGGAIDCQACSVSAGAAVDGVCGVVAADEVCRPSAELFCDLAERCDGASLDCPADRGRRAGEVCDADCGAVCPLADPSGSPHVCPICP